jgi:hypothetical protein
MGITSSHVRWSRSSRVLGVASGSRRSDGTRERKHAPAACEIVPRKLRRKEESGVGYFKTSLGLETPEAGNSPSITGDLKKLAGQINALLLKQLTALVELAKLKVTETVELPAESITEAMLKAKAISDAKIATGKALLATGNSYTTVFVKKAEAEAGVEPSSTRAAFVFMQEYPTGLAVGGVTLPVQSTAGGTSFLVPPGQKWKATPAGGEMKVSTLLL